MGVIAVVIMLQQFNLKKQLEKFIMATKQSFDDLRTAMDDETNALAAKIDALTAKIAAGGMSAEEEAAVLADFTAISERLKTLGADPAEPIPPTV